MKALSLDRQCVQQPLASLENIKEQDDEMDHKHEHEEHGHDSHSETNTETNIIVVNNREEDHDHECADGLLVTDVSMR